MSFLKSKHSGWTWDLKRTPFTGGGGSGGGGGQPTQTTAYNTNVPEYARPYVENMLQSTQAQIYNDDMTGFRPYQPYSSDVNNYFAGFSPLQQSAQQSAYNMQTPGQYDVASGLAGIAGVQALGAGNQAGQLGQQALGYGQAGQMYGDVGQMYGAQGAQQAQIAAQNAQLQAQRFGQQAVRTGQQSLGYGAQGAGYGAGAQQFGLSAAELAAQQGLGYGAQGAEFGAQAAGLAPSAQRYGAEAADVGREGLGYGRLGAGYGAEAAGLSPIAQVFGQEAADIGAAGGAGAQALAEQVAQQSTGYGSQLAGSGQLGLLAGEEMGAIGSQGLGYGAAGAGYGGAAAGLAPAAQQYGQSAVDIGLGGLGYGALGAGYGGRGAQAAEQGFGAGEAFARQATDPAATQAYMSPYMQNVVDYQKSQALRDFQIGKGMRGAQAVGQGAFGGSRQAIVESEAERALGSQLQGIAATGSQKAFEDAQRQQQFGANLGVQGLQAGYGGLGLGLQGAQTGLSGLGTAMQGQQAGLAGLGQAGSLYGQGMQGAQAGLAGLGTALQGQQGRLAGLASYQQGLQGAQSGLGQTLGAGQLGLAGTQQSLAGQQARLNALGQAGQFLGQGMQGAQVGMAGISPALQGLQGAQAGLGQAGQLYGQGMQGAQTGLQGLQGALAGSAQGLQGFQTGLQGSQAGMQGVQGALAGYNTGLSGVGQQLGAGQLGLQGTAQGMQGAQAGMQGAGLGLQGVGQAIGAGQYGLAGLGQATQAAGTLGQLGTQQLGAEQSIANLQNQMGAQQQGLEQSKINQAIQDYAIAQQYPMMQLGLMSNMLRGLPMQAQTTQLYQAQPSTLQQGIGLAGAAGTLFGGRAKGGIIKMAEGGIAGYKYGGAIPGQKLEGMAAKLEIPQLVERLKDPQLDEGEKQIFRDALNDKNRNKARSSGIAAAGGGLFNTMGYAGGGILAFADEGLVEDPQFGGGQNLDADQARLDQIKLQKDMQQYEFLKTASPVAAERLLSQNPMLRNMVAPPAPAAAPPKPAMALAPAPAPAPAPGSPAPAPVTAKGLEAYMADQERMMGQNTVSKEFSDKLSALLGGMGERESRDDRAAMRKAFVELGTKASPGGFMQAATGAIGTYGDARDAARKVRENMDLELTKMQADIKKGERAEKRGNLDAASKSYENAENRQLRIAEMQNQLKVAGISASRASEFERQYEAFKADPKQFEQFKKSLTSQDDTARLNAYVKADEFIAKAYPNLVFSNKPEDKAKLEKLRTDKVAEYLGAISKGAPAAPAGGGGAKGQVDTKNPLLGS